MRADGTWESYSAARGDIRLVARPLHKVLHTAPLQGSRRNDFALTYGGPGSNVIGLYHQRTAAGALYNQIIGLGSGFGDDQLSSTQDNLVSQENVFLRQSIRTYSNVTTQDQLNGDVAADLAMASQLLDVPQIVVPGVLWNGIPFVGVGDRVQVFFPTHPFLGAVSGQWFRVEQMDVRVSDNDDDYEITLTLDQYGFVAGQ